MRATTIIAVIAAALACAASVSAQDDIGFLQFVGNMPSRRSDADAETIGDMILMTGGCDGEQVCQEVALSTSSFCSCSSITSNIEVYFPGNNTWGATNTLPSMPIARYRHNSIHYGQNLYIFGGRALDDTLLTQIDVLNLDTKVWSTVQPPASMLPLIGSDNAYWTVGDNTFVFAGGYSQNYDTLNTTVIVTVDPKNATNISWSAGPEMPLSRGDFSAAAIDATHTMLIGGFTDGNFCTPQQSTAIFDASSADPAQWKYTAGPAMPLGGADQAVSYFRNTIYVFGGQTKDAACHSNFDNGSNVTLAYKISQKDWDIQVALPLGLFRFASAPWTNTSGVDYLYVIGGQESSTVFNGTRFNPVADTIYRFVPSAVAKPNAAAAAAPAGALAVLAAAAAALLAL